MTASTLKSWEDVLKLNEFFERTFDKAWNDAEEEKRKRISGRTENDES